MSNTLRLSIRVQEAAASMAAQGRRRNERGDVPGWVLITLMTAGLVTALWVVAKGQLVTMFQSAMSSVTG